MIGGEDGGRLEGGTIEDEGIPSSGSLDRFRLLTLLGPRLAEAMFDRRGELDALMSVLNGLKIRYHHVIPHNSTKLFGLMWTTPR